MEQTEEFFDFILECQKNDPQITLPTIELLWIQKQSETETDQDEKPTKKKK